jgi:hypothetical protein
VPRIVVIVMGSTRSTGRWLSPSFIAARVPQAVRGGSVRRRSCAFSLSAGNHERLEATSSPVFASYAPSARPALSLQSSPRVENESRRLLARIGGWAAIAMLALVPFQLVVYVVSPPPDSVIGWFELFQRNRLVALVDLDLVLLIDYLLAGFVFLGLWVTMRSSSPGAASIMLVLELIAITTYIASNPAIEMMSLADRYSSVATDAQRQQILAAGEATSVTWTGTAFVMSYLLSAFATVIASVVMLRTRAFTRTTGVIGIIYGALNLVPSSAGTLGLVLSLASLLPMLAWLALVARGLLSPRRRWIDDNSNTSDGSVALPGHSYAT